MSETGHSRPAPLDEATVEAAVRAVLTPLDEKLNLLTHILLSVWVFVFTPAVVILLIQSHVWPAFLVGLTGGLLILLPLSLWLSGRLARGAARQFNERFPEDGLERRPALRILLEMDSPSRAEDRLLAALRALSPTGFVPEDLLEEDDTEPAPRDRGGAFDYMPLKPRTEERRGEAEREEQR